MEKLTDIELEGIQLTDVRPRSLARDISVTSVQDDIETAVGPIHVTIQGDRSKKAMITYHDIGLNSSTCFQGFFNYPDMQPILKHFCVYHIDAPGQQEGALPLPQGIPGPDIDQSGMRNSESVNLLQYSSSANNTAPMSTSKRRASLGFSGDQKLMKNYHYPDLEQLAEMLLPVMQFYNIRTFIGFGVGAGANILSRFALAHPDKIDGLCLINSTCSKAGWTEWGFQKWNSWYLKSGNLTATVEDYLLWHWFGQKTMQQNHDLVSVYSGSIKAINPQNLAHFIDAYVKRTDLGIVREISQLKKGSVKNFRCPVMLVAGDNSPHLDDTVNMNSRLDPANSTWMKFECGGMVHEEAPGKLCDAFRLFLQGMGYVPNERKPAPVPTLSSVSLAQSRSSIASNTNLFRPRGDESKSSKTNVKPAYQPQHMNQAAVC